MNELTIAPQIKLPESDRTAIPFEALQSELEAIGFTMSEDRKYRIFTLEKPQDIPGFGNSNVTFIKPLTLRVYLERGNTVDTAKVRKDVENVNKELRNSYAAREHAKSANLNPKPGERARMNPKEGFDLILSKHPDIPLLYRTEDNASEAGVHNILVGVGLLPTHAGQNYTFYAFEQYPKIELRVLHRDDNTVLTQRLQDSVRIFRGDLINAEQAALQTWRQLDERDPMESLEKKGEITFRNNFCRYITHRFTFLDTPQCRDQAITENLTYFVKLRDTIKSRFETVQASLGASLNGNSEEIHFAHPLIAQTIIHTADKPIQAKEFAGFMDRFERQIKTADRQGKTQLEGLKERGFTMEEKTLGGDTHALVISRPEEDGFSPIEITLIGTEKILGRDVREEVRRLKERYPKIVPVKTHSNIPNVTPSESQTPAPVVPVIEPSPEPALALQPEPPTFVERVKQVEYRYTGPKCTLVLDTSLILDLLKHKRDLQGNTFLDFIHFLTKLDSVEAVIIPSMVKMELCHTIPTSADHKEEMVIRPKQHEKLEPELRKMFAEAGLKATTLEGQSIEITGNNPKLFVWESASQMKFYHDLKERMKTDPSAVHTLKNKGENECLMHALTMQDGTPVIIMLSDKQHIESHVASGQGWQTMDGHGIGYSDTTSLVDALTHAAGKNLHQEINDACGGNSAPMTFHSIAAQMNDVSKRIVVSPDGWQWDVKPVNEDEKTSVTLREIVKAGVDGLRRKRSLQQQQAL